jgi:hypothetical protein
MRRRPKGFRGLGGPLEALRFRLEHPVARADFAARMGERPRAPPADPARGLPHGARRAPASPPGRPPGPKGRWPPRPSVGPNARRGSRLG